jgi:hypothetical protein
MRVSDPAAYDEFILLTSGQLLNHQFRGLFFSSSTAATATCTITFNRVSSEGVLSTVTKSILIRVPANSSILVPISGDAINASLTAGTMYAFI